MSSFALRHSSLFGFRQICIKWIRPFKTGDSTHIIKIKRGNFKKILPSFPCSLDKKPLNSLAPPVDANCHTESLCNFNQDYGWGKNNSFSLCCDPSENWEVSPANRVYFKNIPAWLLTRQTKPCVLWNQIKAYAFLFKHRTFGKENGHVQNAFYHGYISVLKLAQDKGHVKAQGLPVKFLLLGYPYLLKRPPAILEVWIAGCFASMIKSQSPPPSPAEPLSLKETQYSRNVE